MMGRDAFNILPANNQHTGGEYSCRLWTKAQNRQNSFERKRKEQESGGDGSN